MKCIFEKLIYPKVQDSIKHDSYTIAIYKPIEKLKDMYGNEIRQVKVVGYGLPIIHGLKVEMEGSWSKNVKHGLQFEMISYTTIIEPGKEGIISYLSSGLIKGIGSKTAEKIYQRFGDNTLHILDDTPEKLLSVTGISKNKLERIRDSYLETRAARDTVAFLAPYGIRPNLAVKAQKYFGKNTLDIVKNHPYQLCEITGIGFKTADSIAQNLGLSPLSSERIEAGLLYTLQTAEGEGHVCMFRDELIEKCFSLLNINNKQAVVMQMSKLLCKNIISIYKNYIYRWQTEYAEKFVAKKIFELSKKSKKKYSKDLNQQINKIEHSMGITLAKEQRHAIHCALTLPLLIISGGPGTGKTLIQKVILQLYKENFPNGKIICCAPTGAAARRMEQSAGHPAATVHKTLGLLGSEDEDPLQLTDSVDADLVLVDETSMLDISLTKYLLNALPDRCQLIFIGDADQLPSVGPGAVLNELINSKVVPVVILDQVFRQDKGSKIAMNAQFIRHGMLALEEGHDFNIYESPHFSNSANILEKLYLQEVELFGLDKVTLLTPFRHKTDTGVDAMNLRLRDKINPSAPHKTEITIGNRIFREGDKVMQIKNNGDINNGDIGYITHITKADGEFCVCIDFSNGREMKYEKSEALSMIDLGYASTVHKSQGNEYSSVLISLQTGHYVMLKRPLIYTAITRAKERVNIVGQRKAICMAIKNTDDKKRGTLLCARIQEMAKIDNKEGEI